MLRLHALLLAAAVLASTSFAHATAITYNVTGGILYGNGGGTYSGTAVIDSVTGVFSGGTFTARLQGVTYSNLTFASNRPLSLPGAPATFGGRYTSGNVYIDFEVLPSADGGYEGGGVCTGQTCGGNDTILYTNHFVDCSARYPCATGNGGNAIDPNALTDFPPSTPSSLPTAATPEPSSLVLLGTGILSLARCSPSPSL